MSALAINTMIILVNAWTRYVREHLEVEESGRAVASLQGHLAGYKRLIGFLSAEFSLPQSVLEDDGDIPTPTCKVEDMDTNDFRQLGLDSDDPGVDALLLDIKVLLADPRWFVLLHRVEERTEQMKTYLIDFAEKSRDSISTRASGRG